MKKHTDLKNIIFLSAFMIFIFSIYIFFERWSIRNNEEYFNNFDLKLSGVVIHDEVYTASYKIIVLDVKESNYEVFDQRDSLNHYFCIKKNNIVVFCDNRPIDNHYEIGDSIEINGSKQELQCFDYKRNLKFVDSLHLIILNFPRQRFDELIEEFTSEKGKKDKK